MVVNHKLLVACQQKLIPLSLFRWKIFAQGSLIRRLGTSLIPLIQSLSCSSKSLDLDRLHLSPLPSNNCQHGYPGYAYRRHHCWHETSCCKSQRPSLWVLPVRAMYPVLTGAITLASDSEVSIDRFTNRGNKLKRKAHYVHERQLDRPNGPKVYKRVWFGR